MSRRRVLAGEIAKRALLAFVTLLTITLVTFLATNLLPGDPAQKALGLFSTPERRAEFRERQGLDRPVLERYGEWLGNVATGDWGTSPVDNRRVAERVEPRIVRSVTIAVAGFLIALPIALLAGTYAARRAGSRSDSALSTLAVLTASLPEFVIAIGLILVLAVQFSLLPVESSSVSTGNIDAYVLPSLALAAVTVPYVFRMVRANVREVLGAPYIRAARLRGVHGWRLTIGHVAPSAALPLVNAITLSLAELLGGIIVIETVFAFPGIGQLLVEAVQSGDTQTIQVLAVLIGGAFVVLNAIADITVTILDPRLSESAS